MLIALGSGGTSDALKLHPLSIIASTTAGGVFAERSGSVFAAPFTKTANDARHGVKAAGVSSYSDDAADSTSGADALGTVPPIPADEVAGG